jgi:hypothetical protein
MEGWRDGGRRLVRGAWCVVREGRRVGGLRGGIAEKARGGWGHGGAEAQAQIQRPNQPLSHLLVNNFPIDPPRSTFSSVSATATGRGGTFPLNFEILRG